MAKELHSIDDLLEVMVEQNARQTLAIADCGYVLAKGRVVAAGTAAELGRAREVHEAYFG